MDAKEDQDAPDLLESNELIRHLATPENLVNAIDDDPIRTKAKFNLFFNDAFEDGDTIKFEYDNDSVVLIKPGLYFNQLVSQKRSRSKKRPDESETKDQVNEDTDEIKSSETEPKDETKERPESKLLLDPANFEARKPRTRQSSDRKRQSSTSSVNSQNNSTQNEPKTTIITDRTRGRSPSDEEAPNKRVRRSSSRVSSPLVRYSAGGEESDKPVSSLSQNSSQTTSISVPTRTQPKRASTSKSFSEPKVETKTENRQNEKKKEPKVEKEEPKIEPKTRKRNDSGKKETKTEPKTNVKEVSKKTKPLKGVTGLKNLGNTCYLNTIVQVLASLKCFRVALSEVESAMSGLPVQVKKREDSPKRQNPPRSRKRQTSLTKSLQKLVNELSAGNKRTVEPSYFVQAVNEQMPSFKGHLQQDVQEFFCQLLSKLNNEKTHPDPNCSEEILNCVVNRMFTGAWQSEVTCIGCGNSNQNKEQFNTLPLEFPNKYHKIQTASKSITLDHLLQFYTQSERLGRVYNCVNCTATVNGRARRTSVRTEAAKRITVLESPKCLFVHLKRAKYSQQVGQEKITCHVDFPQSLNLGPYMTHADKENNPEYLLRAVVVHHGKHFASGHYTTFCWIDNNNKKSSHSGWVEYNDSEVHPANIKDVLSSQAYMLLYVDRDLANEI